MSEEMALGYLRDHPGSTTSEVGAYLWGTKFRKPQSYARPAGKLLNRLLARGAVRKGFDRDAGYTRWWAT